MVLILTATVHPAEGVFNLSVKDKEERCRQYKQALKYYIENVPGIKVVFCDNSDMNVSEFDDVIKLGQKSDCQLEILTFEGNVQETLKKGKGFGECEIINYALKNSRLIADDTDHFFIKVTGRLILTNLAKQIKGFKNNDIYINSTVDGDGKAIADTRTFAMNTEKYRNYFETAGELVDDQNGVFLERIYYNTILGSSLETRNMPYFPRIIGISGSNGYQYSYKEWKCKVKDILSRFNHYGVK